MKAPGFENTSPAQDVHRTTRFGETAPSMRDAQTAYEAYFKHTQGKTHDGKPMPPWAELSPEVRAAWAASAAALVRSNSHDTPPRGRVSDTGEPTPQERQQQQEARERSSQQRAQDRFRERPKYEIPAADRQWVRSSEYSPSPPVGPPMPADPNVMHTPLAPPGATAPQYPPAYAPEGPHQAVSPMGGSVAPAPHGHQGTEASTPHGHQSAEAQEQTRAPHVNVPTNTPKHKR
jgi:hypothetical protein